MKAKTLKDKIISENKIRLILTELGMKRVSEHEKHFSCGMPNMRNGHSSTIIYKDNLKTVAHTRNIAEKGKSDKNTDIISLVMFIKGVIFSKAMKWICDTCEYNYYEKEEELSPTLLWLQEMESIEDKDIDEDELKDLTPLDEYVLSYYGQYTNSMFRDDGISYETQRLFELGYDLESHRVTIPIRDEHSTLVGVKGRLYKETLADFEMKYMYLFRCAKSRILFGLNLTAKYIKKTGIVYVFESEKAVMQMWSRGIKNCVAIGSHKISRKQSLLLSQLDATIIFCYDQGIGVKKERDEDDMEYIVYDDYGQYVIDYDFWNGEFEYLYKGSNVGILWDDKKILDKGESPSDDGIKWAALILSPRMTTVK